MEYLPHQVTACFISNSCQQHKPKHENRASKTQHFLRILPPGISDLRDFLKQRLTSPYLPSSGCFCHEISWSLFEFWQTPRTHNMAGSFTAYLRVGGWCPKQFPWSATATTLSTAHLVLQTEQKPAAAIHPAKGFNTKQHGLETLSLQIWYSSYSHVSDTQSSRPQGIITVILSDI